MNPTTAHQFASDFTGFGKLRYLRFFIEGSSGARAVWSQDDGVAIGATDLILPQKRLVVVRIQTRIAEAITVIGGSGDKYLVIDLAQPPQDLGVQQQITTLQDFAVGDVYSNPSGQKYIDQLSEYLAQIRVQANAATGTPTGWTGKIQIRIGYQIVHNFDDLPDSLA